MEKRHKIKRSHKKTKKEHDVIVKGSNVSSGVAGSDDIQTDEKGLTSTEASQLLKKYGANEFKKTEKVSTLKILVSQFISPLMIILMIAAIASFVIGYLPGQKPNLINPILIGSLVVISGVVGFFQDYKSERTMEALQKMAALKSTVIRNGHEIRIPSEEIVPGDIVVVEGGDVIPADAQVLTANNLAINEAPLTGESDSVLKKIKDMVFMNTYVVAGDATLLVKFTGMDTRVGKIAGRLQKIKEGKTPFESEISNFSKKISWVILAITIIVGVVGFFKFDLTTDILTAIALAVAAMPEVLPAVITLTLAVGAKTMGDHDAAIRKLSVTESIGAVDIICTDKTGTITENSMMVTKIYANNKYYEADKIPKRGEKSLNELFMVGALCNRSRLISKGRKSIEQGDPTEIALYNMSSTHGFVSENLKKSYKQIYEIPFSSARKMMSIVYNLKGQKIMFTKGAPEVLVKKCNRILIDGRVSRLSETAKKDLLQKNKDMASNGLRVIGFAYRKFDHESHYHEEKLVWVGLQAMLDPPRKGVKEAVKKCYASGIRIIMLTGDNPLTAQTIAKEVELSSKGYMLGGDIDKLTDKELEKRLDAGCNIFARVSPVHKLRILNLLQKNFRVAMTGDGVNDALALKKADVGIAMGINGTEVAKQASDIVLLNDSFVTIVVAIKEGRRIFENIRKFINYLFTTNLSEVMVVFFATLFLNLGGPIITPIQLLWVNLITDGIPAIALGLDPPSPGTMDRPPRKKNEPLINNQMKWIVGTIGTKKTIILLAVFFIVLPMGMTTARTALFTAFVIYEFVRIGTIRAYDGLSWFSNKYLLGSVVISVGLQIVLLYTVLGNYFGTVPLGIYPWMIIIAGVVIGYVLAVIITKFIIKHVKGDLGVPQY